ncbi:IclR family transcriptional regulator C-terminal domain-containing protein [Streptomyces griseorubiginosus]|uniref:IclR family transcriptional regulator domain-containing protein n=1 Tax=Streptomyces griseorubiginosus TaxID=67304 RepID=UPI00099E4051
MVTRLAGAAILCLKREDADVGLVRISYQRGQILPTNAGASAYVLRAWLPGPEVDAKLDAARFEPFTEVTLAAKRDRMRQRRETRKRGYAVSRGEIDGDVLGVAGRLHNKAADGVAALSVAAVFARVADERLP